MQERSGLVAGLLCAFLFLVIVAIRDKKSLVISVLVLVVATFFVTRFGSLLFSFEDMRYVSLGLKDEKRIDYVFDALKWVQHHPMGGASSYYALGGEYPHNFFVNAFLYGGVFGGLILTGILIVQLIKIAQITLSFIKKDTRFPLLLVSCLAYLCYTMNSFFHNYSLVFGGEMIFLLWAMISSLLDVDDDSFDELEDSEEVIYSDDSDLIIDTQ